MKKRILSVLCVLVLIPELIYAQVGPGLGNLTYNSSELYQSIWDYTEVDHMGSTMATMCNGYLITTFHPDSGVPPGGILVWDVSNPRAPKLIKRVYSSQTASFREMHALPQHEHKILFQDGCGFQVWDFSNPSDPVLIKRHCMSGYGHDDYGSTWQMFWQAPYIYIGNGSAGFDIVDASDLNNPQLVRHVTSPRQVGPIFAVGNLLITSAHDFGRGFTLYDISDPRNPKLINSYSNTENMYASSLNGNMLVISARGNTNNAVFGTYDISDPYNIKKLATLDIGNSGEQLYSSTQDNFIFQGCQNEVVKIDASTPSDLKIEGRGHLVTGNVDHGQVSPMGNLIFVGNDHGTGSGFWVHQMEPDTKAPEVNMVSPRANVVSRALTSRIGVTLTDNILIESIDQSTFIVRPVGGNALSGKYSYQFATINFSPDQALQPNTTYEISIPAGGLKDLTGNPIEIPFLSYFSTGAIGDFPPAAGGTPWVFEEDEQISLFWNNISNSSNYIIKRSVSPTGPFVQIGTTTGTFYTDVDVENDQYYYYTISGENSFGEGASSSRVKAMAAIYITDLNWESSTNAWGAAEVDQSNGEDDTDDGNYITLNGQVYSRGLGVHANSSITYNLSGGDYQRFTSSIGLDDEVGTGGSVIFSVLVDGQEVFNSGLMTGGDVTQTVDVDVSDANTITLNVDSDGDNGLDHASWGGARLRLPQRPYTNVHIVPGRIEAEEYDFGGEGIAYHEGNSNGNEGGATFRNDEVDIEETADTDGDYNIGYILNGEWLEYTIEVQSTASYDLDIRMATDGDGKAFHIEIDGLDVTGSIEVPNTGGWQTWETITVQDVGLTAGEHEMRIVFDADYVNFNYMEFKSIVTDLNALNTLTFQVYPNPYGEAGFTIKTEKSFKYTISDLRGQQLTQGYTNATNIGAQLLKGVYWLKVETDNGSANLKLVKQ